MTNRTVKIAQWENFQVAYKALDMHLSQTNAKLRTPHPDKVLKTNYWDWMAQYRELLEEIRHAYLATWEGKESRRWDEYTEQKFAELADHASGCSEWLIQIQDMSTQGEYLSDTDPAFGSVRRALEA